MARCAPADGSPLAPPHRICPASVCLSGLASSSRTRPHRVPCVPVPVSIPLPSHLFLFFQVGWLARSAEAALVRPVWTGRASVVMGTVGQVVVLSVLALLLTHLPGLSPWGGAGRCARPCHGHPPPRARHPHLTLRLFEPPPGRGTKKHEVPDTGLGEGTARPGIFLWRSQRCKSLSCRPPSRR